jgi:hypothetical protein
MLRTSLGLVALMLWQPGQRAYMPTILCRLLHACSRWAKHTTLVTQYQDMNESHNERQQLILKHVKLVPGHGTEMAKQAACRLMSRQQGTISNALDTIWQLENSYMPHSDIQYSHAQLCQGIASFHSGYVQQVCSLWMKQAYSSCTDTAAVLLASPAERRRATVYVLQTVAWLSTSVVSGA